MNSKRGGITVHALGAEYTLRITMNAMVSYQDQAGETFVAGLTALQDDPSDLKRMRGLFAAAIGEDPTKTGDVMDDLGLETSIEKLSEAAALAFPSGDDEGNEVGVKAPDQ